MSRLARAVAVGLAIALWLPASAGSAPSSTTAFTDTAGDANHVNHQQGGLPVGDEGPDTRPASIGSADLLGGRYETMYVSVPEHDEDGNVVRVRREATGLRLHLTTTLPAAPSFGPTVSTEVWMRLANCPLVFRMVTRGPLSAADDPPQGAGLWTRFPECPGGARSYSAGISLDVRGSISVLEFPFTALQTPAGPLLQVGDLIGPDPDRAAGTSVVRTSATELSGPLIDTASPIHPFTIGADLPPDVDCVETPAHHECLGEDGPPDTGEDLHDALLGSGPAPRTGLGAGANIAEEYVVTSFRPDGRWMTFDFDVAGAGFDEDYVEINLAARLMRNGQVSDEWLTFADSFVAWKLVSGPADDPYRSLSSIVQDTPWGVSIALPREGLDRLTLLAGGRVRRHQDIGLVLGFRGTNEPFFGEPFPDSFGPWIQSWTQGLRKFRLQADDWGRGVEMSAWIRQHGTTSTYDARRNVTVQDERTRVAGVAEPGAMRLDAEMHSTGPALSDASLFYSATADQDVTLEWRSPAGTKRGSRSTVGSSGASLWTTEPDAGAGTYGVTLDAESGVELSSSVTYIHDLWTLDPGKLFPGLQGRFLSTPEMEPAVLTPGTNAAGPAPPLILTLGPGGATRLPEALHHATGSPCSAGWRGF